MIQAKVIADSKNTFGNRMTTMVVTFPRYILAELNTHRMFSRNSASSRAIPFNKMMESVQNNPFIPMAWQKDHKGMQGSEYITNDLHVERCKEDWLAARDNAIESAILLNNGFPVMDSNYKQVGTERINTVTKQLCNRLLEPFMWHTVIITATEWENFFYQRCPQYQFHDAGEYEFRSKKDVINHFGKDEMVEGRINRTLEELTELDWLEVNGGQADIHMMALAEAMWDALNESTPIELKEGEWHIPFISSMEVPKLQDRIKGIHDPNNPFPIEELYKRMDEIAIKVAVAKCARISYTVVGEEKDEDYEKDILLHDRLIELMHPSPFEHIGQAMTAFEYNTNLIVTNGEVTSKGASNNLRGFKQYRQILKI